jgi:TolB protein
MFIPPCRPTGKKLVFNSTRSGHPDVWIKDMITGKETALTDDPLNEDRTLLSPDGSKVAYQTLEGGNINPDMTFETAVIFAKQVPVRL